MIYHLFEYLRQYDIPGQGLFTYLSFRAMLTSITAMLLSFSRAARSSNGYSASRSERQSGISGWKARCRRKALRQWVVSSSSLRLWFLSCCSAT